MGEPEPRLHLLLDEYGKRSPRIHGNGAPSPTDSRSTLPDDDFPHLLLEDFKDKSHRWQEKNRDAKPAPPPPADPTALKLLLEDFQPQLRPRPGISEAQTTRISQRYAQTAGGQDPLKLHLEVDWDDDTAHTRVRWAKAVSLLVHSVLMILALLQPHVRPQDLPTPEEFETVALVAPSKAVLRELTQNAPVSKGADKPFQGLAEPQRPTAVVVPEPPKPQPKVIEETPPQVPTQPDPPKIEQPEPTEPPAPKPAETPPPAPRAPAAAQSPNPDTFRPGTEIARKRVDELPMPRAPQRTVEKPKLQLENPKASTLGREGDLKLGSLALNARPDEIIEGAVQNMARGAGGRQVVGDGSANMGGAGYLPPSPGNTGSNVELLSDPQGVDFRPYLTQILAAVRRNWYAVIPESARLGLEKGRVSIQFAVITDGTVSKLVIADSSGSQPLDRAAVAGISASHPFPPLPAEFHGKEVRIQFAFLYNIRPN